MKNSNLIENYKVMFYVAIFIAIYLFSIDFALAAGDPFAAIDKEGKTLTVWLTGNFMAMVGVVAIVAMAIATAAGKLDWKYALTVGLAILIGLYAQDIVDALKPAGV
jgi:type IV secretory pathway VirB2 component (pilin)